MQSVPTPFSDPALVASRSRRRPPLAARRPSSVARRPSPVPEYYATFDDTTRPRWIIAVISPAGTGRE